MLTWLNIFFIQIDEKVSEIFAVIQTIRNIDQGSRVHLNTAKNNIFKAKHTILLVSTVYQFVKYVFHFIYYLEVVIYLNEYSVAYPCLQLLIH